MKNKILVSLIVLSFVFLVFNSVNAQVKSNNVITQPSQDASCLWKKETISGINYYYLKDVGKEYMSFSDPNFYQPLFKLHVRDTQALGISGDNNSGTGLDLANLSLGINMSGVRNGIMVEIPAGLPGSSGITVIVPGMNEGISANGTGINYNSGFVARQVERGFRTFGTSIAADFEGSFILRDNAGQGNAYACFDSAGKLFRSAIPCISISTK